ncbi:hypothetical protein CARUB_v10011160mg, partial [Capsella rubella]
MGLNCFIRGYNGRHHQRTDSFMNQLVVSHTQPIAALAIPVDELNDLTDNFSSEALIGEGSNGRVFYGVLKSGKAAAIKKLDHSHQPDHVFLSQVSMVSRFQHDNIVALMGYCVDGPLHVLAFEYAPNGSFHDILHGRKGVKGAPRGPVLTWQQRVKIAVGAARGLEYLHKKVNPQVIYRDIKSSNILVFDDDVSKVADLDMSDKVIDMAAHFYSTGCVIVGSFGHRAPEYTLTGTLSTKSDVYCFGIVLLELLTGRKDIDFTLPPGEMSLERW